MPRLEFQNRNRIRIKEGWQWLTVPVVTKDRYFQKICEVEIDETREWKTEHHKALQQHYHKASHFAEHSDFFVQTYQQPWRTLVELCIHLNAYFFASMEITTPVHKETELGTFSRSSKRIVEICKHLGADTYLSGIGGKHYLDEELFRREGITLRYQEFSHPTYPQCYPGFEPNLAAVDLLCNCGTSSRGILMGESSCTRDFGS